MTGTTAPAGPRWYHGRLAELAALGGYQKPEKVDGVLKLDSNENFVIGKRFQQDVIAQARAASDVREYPLGGAERLVSRLSQHLRVPREMIGVGNGSDQILDLLLANLGSRRTRVLTPDPTFGFFEERCRLYGIPRTGIPFSEGMTLDPERFARYMPRCRMLYVDSPNNPTGFQFPRAQLESLVRGFDGLVVVDEAYGEFGDYTAVPMVKKHGNVVVVKTFSKAFGLAGLRLGYFVAPPDVAGVFNRVVQYPYPVSTVAIEAGIAALDRADQMRAAADTVRLERRRVIDGLERYGGGAFTVFESHANFVLFDARGAYKRVFTALAEQGISVRRLGRVGAHAGCLRVTVGTREMNSRFLLAIRDLLE